jgi:hypothetical protein
MVLSPAVTTLPGYVGNWEFASAEAQIQGDDEFKPQFTGCRKLVGSKRYGQRT